MRKYLALVIVLCCFSLVRGQHVPSTTQQFNDETWRVFDNSDPTKRVRLELSGLTTGTTRTLAIPDFNMTFIDWTAATDALYTTGSGRFDGGIGIGIDPTSRLRLNIKGSSSNRIGIQLNNTSTGDVTLQFELGGTGVFLLGVDNSDDDKFKISGAGGVLGTNDYFVIDSSGNVTLGALALTTLNTYTIDQSVASGAAPTFSATNFSDGGTNIIPTATQETNWDTAYGWGDHAGLYHPVAADLDTICDVGATTDQTITAGGFSTAGTIEGIELFNSGGDLKVMPDVQGNVEFFGDTDVAAAGKQINIHRKAATGDSSIRFMIDSYKGAYMIGVGCSGLTFGVVGAATGISPWGNAGEVVTMFKNSASGETRELKIYGYRAGDASRSLEIGCGVDAADTASFDGLSNYWFNGNIRTAADQAWDLGAASAQADFAGDTKIRVTIDGNDFNIVALAVP